MKHILRTGLIRYGNQSQQAENPATPIIDVLEQWAEETGYIGDLNALQIVTVSITELTYFEQNEDHLGQGFDEFNRLVNSSSESGSLLVIITYPSIDIESSLPEGYQTILKEKFHVINNWKIN